MQIPPPLTQRSVVELRAKAAELLSMSDTARTTDTRDALRRLAERFARLAENRIAGAANSSSWLCLQSRDPTATPNP